MSINIREMLCETMYKMYKDDYLQYLDMEDYIVMWQSLCDRWEIRIDDNQWKEFAEEVNSMASDKQSVFKLVFEK